MSVNIKSLPCSDAGACSGGNALVQKLSSDVGILALGSSVSSVVQLTASDDEAANNLAHCALRVVGCSADAKIFAPIKLGVLSPDIRVKSWLCSAALEKWPGPVVWNFCKDLGTHSPSW